MVNETESKVGQEIKLLGWVDSKRDHGKITFVDLRDTTGKIQCVGVGKMSELSTESVVEIVGLVKLRGERMINPNIALGKIELEVTSYQILNKASELPIPLDTDGSELHEEVRLKYRYLDLRRERMHKILILRSNLTRALRDGLYDHNFVEVETPLLSFPTKEGARNFIVPSRGNPGKFYALPQSPQQYKQLLMTAGVERYFQFAKCIRDEDLRADRGYEFTQLDLEMSFVAEEDVRNTIEDIVKKAITSVGGKLQTDPFPVINYSDAIAKYGADKFDLRTDEEKKDNVLAFAWVVRFPFFKKVNKTDKAEVEDGQSGWTFTHNPFSRPLDAHLDWHMNGEHIDEILTTQYDLVCNGYEVGGGSLRAYKSEVLRATYHIMGYTDEQIEGNVGHMLKAFDLGTPPHGGIALGLDRLVMILAGETSLKEAIAFPMTSTGKTAVMDAPTEVSPKQLKELSLEITENKKS